MAINPTDEELFDVIRPINRGKPIREWAVLTVEGMDQPLNFERNTDYNFAIEVSDMTGGRDTGFLRVHVNDSSDITCDWLQST